MQTLTLGNDKLYVLTQKEYVAITGAIQLSLGEIAKMWGISKTRLSELPYLLPPHKKGARNQRYLKSDIDELLKKGRATLEKEYYEQRKRNP